MNIQTTVTITVSLQKQNYIYTVPSVSQAEAHWLQNSYLFVTTQNGNYKQSFGEGFVHTDQK